MNLKLHSIKSLYVLALAEGEGVGTAYEYFAKRLVLRPWLAQLPLPRSLLIAGLPEKYGTSLDFLQIAAELKTAVTVIEDRTQALDKLRNALAAAQIQGRLTEVYPEYYPVDTLTQFSDLGEFDLCLSSEVLQRLTPEARQDYVGQIGRCATAVALFAPNAGNASHANLSGLDSLSLAALGALVRGAGLAVQDSGYIDMPPFPPGITRSEEQREQASSGTLEALAMRGLAYYARLERFLPTGLRRSQSHIVYALA